MATSDVWAEMMQATSRTTRRKLVVVGDGACGKTSLLIAFAFDEFPETHIPTVFETYTTDIKVDGQTVQFALWDTAGQEDYEQLRPLSYPNTDVIVICFSIDNRDSFANVSLKWIPEVRHFCPRTPIILVGTKTDLRYSPGAAYSSSTDKRSVVTSEGQELSRSVKAHRYVECSAKTRDGVDEVFQTAAKAAVFPSRSKRRRRFCVTL